MKYIPLTQAKKAKVSEADFDMLNRFKWAYDSHNHCAVRGIWNKEAKKTVVVSMHRFLMETPKGMDTDHINGDRLDNRRENLRICTHSENQRNMQKHKDNKSGYKGVSWDTRSKKWVSRIKAENGVYRFLGFFRNKLDAAKAYDNAAIKHHGVFAKLNGTGE